MTKTKKYARIENESVVEVIDIDNDQQLSNLYHADLAATFIECPKDIVEGWLYINGKFREPEVIKIDLETYKAGLKNEVDKQAEIERLKYITPGVGQSMTYQEKVNQAASYSGQYAAYLADPENNPKPNDAEYLLLASSLGIDGDTFLQVAGAVTLAYTQWQSVGAEIEKIRLQAKAAIDEASSVEAAQAVYDGITWPQV